ncbi:glycoside hydrolase family 76 protein [Schizophyllum commune Tattone D]|nr:glycoside hydrolase family 76 protein [Schizophyllum commune Tattone D]
MFARLVPIVVAALGVSSVIARPCKRDQCAATLETAANVAQRLQDVYWNTLNGGWGILWTDANTIEDMYNLMMADGTDTFDVISRTRIGILAALGSKTAWELQLNGSNDDAAWIVLALWKVADYKNKNGQDASKYLDSAKTIYDIIASEWDDSTCGGGVWWSGDHTYKNAVTNELFLYLSANGYNRFGDQSYLDNAEKTWDWLKNSGMRNSDGLWNDGLTDDCKNNGQTTWIYNQGVVASGLAQLYVATGDASLLDEAELTLDATISHKTQNGILKESCDDVANSTCNQDQAMFKGIWMKHLQYYLDAVPGSVSKYADFIGAQESAVVHYATGEGYAIENVWYGGSQGGTTFSAQSQDSGLAAHICAAKYGPC